MSISQRTSIIIATLLNIIFWDLLISSFIYDYPELAYQPVLGWQATNNSTKIQALEGFARIKFNNIGLRGREINEKKQDEKRILILGSSYTFAGEVAGDKTFVALLEKKLRGKTKKIRVINGGIPDASIADYIKFLPVLSKKVQPNLVVIQLNARDFWRAIQGSSGLAIRYDEQNPMELEIIDLRSQRLKNKLIKNRFYRFLIDHSGLFSYSNIRFRAFVEKLTEGRKEEGHRHKVNEKNAPLMVKTKKMMQAVILRWRAWKVPIVILLIPEGNGYQGIYCSEREQVLTEWVEEYCTQYGISYINMAGPFTDEFQKNKRFAKGFSNSLPGLGHLNTRGHQLVTDSLLPLLRRELTP